MVRAIIHQDTLGKQKLLTWVVAQSYPITAATMHLYQGRLKLQGSDAKQADKTPTQF
jgi:hypothetical protein